MLLTLVLAFSLAQAAPPRQGAPQTDETVPAQRGGRLTVNNFAGDVVIRAWDKDSIHVVGRHQPRTKVRIRQTGSGVSIDTSGNMGAPGSVDFEISAPAWLAVRVEGTYDFVTIEGMQGEIFANTVRGDVIVKGGSSGVTAKSVEGEVQVDGAKGKVTVSSVNEKIKIANTSGEISAESVNGGITMTGIDSKSVDATTVNGTIVFEGKLGEGGQYNLSTHNGELLLGVPETVNATFTVRTYNGSFSTDLPLQYDRSEMRRGKRITMTLGNGSAEVNLETFGGGIRLRKGSARSHER